MIEFYTTKMKTGCLAEFYETNLQNKNANMFINAD